MNRSLRRKAEKRARAPATAAQQIFARAVQLQVAGALEEAAAAHAKALSLQPDFAEAHYCLGLARHGLGRLDEAIDSYRRAVYFNPLHAVAFNNLGVALKEKGRLEEAEAAALRAVELEPASAMSLGNLGAVLLDRGDLNRALAAIQAALAINPDNISILANLSRGLRRQGKLAEAVAAGRRVVALNPQDASAFNDLGVLLKETGELEEAEAAALRSLELEPTSPTFLGNLGAVLLDRGDLNRAAAAIEGALAAAPDAPAHLANLCCVLRRQGKAAEAIAAGRRAVAMDPNSVPAQFNLAFALGENGEAEESFLRYQRVATLAPDLPDVHFALAQALLRRGDFENGWDEYEWRWRMKDYEWIQGLTIVQKPKWDGEDISDKSILICGEQGLGDTLQFVRYLPEVVARAKRVILWIQPALKTLLRHVEGVTLMGMDESVSGFDVYCPLLSLPRIFRSTPETVPPIPSCIKADPDAVRRWRAKMGDHGFRIGIGWQGKPGTLIDGERSFALASFAPLARIPGVRLISLQKNFGTEQLASLPKDMPVETLGDDFDVSSGPFMDTAAVMMNLDLVVTSDTSIAHLAGALARPTWVALKRIPDWRWGLTEDSVWYPSMRLFRQRVAGDWDALFAEIAEALAASVGEKQLVA
jgi:Flp pilus assembly protein TadD